MNYHVIELGKNYIVAPNACQRKIIGRVISKTPLTITIRVEKYEGIDHEVVVAANGIFEAPYSEVFGREPERCFFS